VFREWHSTWAGPLAVSPGQDRTGVGGGRHWCLREEEDDGARVVVVVLHGGRWLDDVLFLLVTLDSTGTESWVA
jgi:hypothetical protein